MSSTTNIRGRVLTKDNPSLRDLAILELLKLAFPTAEHRAVSVQNEGEPGEEWNVWTRTGGSEWTSEVMAQSASELMDALDRRQKSLRRRRRG